MIHFLTFWDLREKISLTCSFVKLSVIELSADVDVFQSVER